ncbi:hypothetical protein [Aminobacter sp. AP02]|uniref:hypothetical protein n=1 Tax=Aminobacter sp. AP02 TaxID=2135737 RepID=UPI000D6BBF71|nr:hypothetical protein [Aminobacter sp. AP02]PWK75672.1 hypothetical protein C8K44_103240 [Aminobacter sp. AP02]
MQIRNLRILILCKTYPSPSGKYAETSCVAGMDETGDLIRLFPVPFRLITEEQQFKKWQWITTKVRKSSKDHRPESHTILVDTIHRGVEVSTKDGWAERRRLMDKLALFSDFKSLNDARISNNRSLGLLKPARILSLDIAPALKQGWTPEELAKLEQDQKQAGLFDEREAKIIKTLRKIPFDFYYSYECHTPTGPVAYRHKIVDWEAGALYWNCVRSHGNDWERAFRFQMETRLPGQDLTFLMGNIHRFPDQWLIVSLIYPPRRTSDQRQQGELF